MADSFPCRRRPTQPLATGLNPDDNGVHLKTPSEYILLQQRLLHWELDEHIDQSARLLIESEQYSGVVPHQPHREQHWPFWHRPSPRFPPPHEPTHPLANGSEPMSNGVHLWIPFEYMLLQHPLVHWELVEHKDQSPSLLGGELGLGTGCEVGILSGILVGDFVIILVAQEPNCVVSDLWNEPPFAMDFPFTDIE